MERDYSLPSKLEELIKKQFSDLKNNFYNYYVTYICKFVDADGISWIKVNTSNYILYYRITEKNELLKARDKFFYAQCFIPCNEEGDEGDIIQFYDIEYLDEVRKKMGDILTIYNTFEG